MLSMRAHIARTQGLRIEFEWAPQEHAVDGCDCMVTWVSCIDFVHATFHALRGVAQRQYECHGLNKPGEQGQQALQKSPSCPTPDYNTS